MEPQRAKCNELKRWQIRDNEMLYKDRKTHNIRDIEKYITFSLLHIVTSMITIPGGEILTMYNQMTPPMSLIHQLKEREWMNDILSSKTKFGPWDNWSQ